MSPPDAEVFEVLVADEPDALSRLLAPFAVVQARLAHVEYVARSGGARVTISALGLSPHAAELLRLKIAQAPRVISALRASVHAESG